MPASAVFSPAKINLFLAITGRRADGFHELVSVVAQLEFGDNVAFEPAARAGFSLVCNAPEVPRDESNLVLRAAKAFCETTGWEGGGRFVVEKRIPVGAGLGGGSSNAVAALRLLNDAAGRPLGPEQLAALAVGLGSDCALFLAGGPVVMRGRGERIESLSLDARERLRGQRLLVFKPSFGISTAWAYGRMAADAPASYLAAERAEERLQTWLANERAGAAELLFNNMEGPAFAKYLALPTLLERLRERFSLPVAMSGSGSACFAILPENAPEEDIVACIHTAWGKHAFVVETRIS